MPNNMQQEGVPETKFLKVFNIRVEEVNASGINFAALSKPSVEDATTALNLEGSVSRDNY